MMEHPAQQIPENEPLQLLACFSQDLDWISDLPCLAERILAEFCRATHHTEGSLYLLIQSPHRFKRLAIQGSPGHDIFPSIIMRDHPLVLQVPLLQQTFGQSANTPHTTFATPFCLPLSELGRAAKGIVIPLYCRKRLLAIVLLRSWIDPNSPTLTQTELLTVMAHIAGASLNTLRVRELDLCAQALMCSADRWHTVEYMADSLAHAVRNPLTSIKTFIHLAGERKDDPQFLSNFSQMALEDVRRVEQLTQEIFDYLRYRTPNPTEEDVNDIVSSCLYFLELTVRHRRIKIEKDLAPEPPRGMVDKQQLQQALLSLLVNAVEAIGPLGGTLRIRTRCLMKPNGTAWSHIDIEDTGQGISAKNLERIFDPFFTTKCSDGERKHSGLGLTIAQQIINAHQGEIHVQSTEGVGTTCSIYLPLCTV